MIIIKHYQRLIQNLTSFKIRPVLESAVSHFRSTAAEEKHSIDEPIIPTKGRSSLKQYLTKTPINGRSKYGQGVVYWELFMTLRCIQGNQIRTRLIMTNY